MNDGLRPRRLAVFVSGHGFGHLTRTSALLCALVKRINVRLTVLTAAPRAIWPRELAPYTDAWIALSCDPGVVQLDELAVDLGATSAAVQAWLDDSRGACRAVVRQLEEGSGVDGVLADVPPLAFDVARVLGIPSIALANFSWDWIYEQLGLDAGAAAARQAYERATLLLELTPKTPMPAFPRRTACGVIGRRAARGRAEARRALGVAEDERCVLLAIRAPTLDRIYMPVARSGVRYLSPSPRTATRGDITTLPPEMDFVDAVAAADVVLARTGYGIIADCATNESRLLWVRRHSFPEDPYLERWLEAQEWASQVTRDALLTGAWEGALENALCRPCAAPRGDDAVGLAAAEVARLLL